MANLISIIVLTICLLYPNVQSGSKGWILFTDVGDHWKLKVIKVESGAQVQQLFADDDGNNSYATWLPDGQIIGLARRDPTDGGENITVRAITGGTYRYIAPDPERRTWPIWSPNGKWIAFVEDGNFVTGDRLMIMPTS